MRETNAPGRILPKSVSSEGLGVESPFAILWPLPATAISGEVGTMALTAKSNGDSSLSLLLIVTVLVYVPGVADEKLTVNVSDAPGTRFVTR